MCSPLASRGIAAACRTMIRITISSAANESIKSTLAFDAEFQPAERKALGDYLVWFEQRWRDRRVVGRKRQQRRHHAARRRKPTKVAIVAIMRKLLILANVLVRDRRKWPANP